ncbi:cation:proton antiporter [Gloeocapsopsis crepidinum LEGE 06123]|uniref:Cation:proton antiporter n=1 Tax=Gloeocapsopsis crepidinum LEGE 06123 TaxID=588587 RepID=A0ABR9ULB9_9CHRO|nr:cation:proton antiporter [Gloeocapsopsis crepidinum]MBE9189075.1 cation:proton antiporter [Gloeocapsopsis crepidinum LEGE 06123]
MVAMLNVYQNLPLIDPVYIFGVLLLTILIAPAIATILRIPSLVVLILLGTVLGTNILGILDRSIVGVSSLGLEQSQQLLLHRQSLLQGLEKFGLLYIMLIAGMQMDLTKMKRLGLCVLIFGLLTFGIPFYVGFLSGQLITSSLLAAVLLGIIYSPHTLVSYPIVVRVGIAQQEIVSVAVGGTIVTSVLTLTSLSIVQSIHSASVGAFLWIKLLFLLPLLVIVSLWGIPKIGRLFLEKNTELSSQFVFVLACLFVVASVTLIIGFDPIVGAFIAGLALNRLVPLQSPLMKQVEFVGNSLFIPIFLVTVGILSNPKIFFTKPEYLGVTCFAIAGAIGAKFLASWLAGLAFKFTFAEVMTVFGLTMSRAALVLVIAVFGKSANLIDEGIFNIVIAYIVVTCLVGPLITDLFSKRVAEKLLLSK